MKGTPSFQFYPADFLTDENVVMMTLDQLGAYVLLMAYCWKETSLPVDIARLGRLCRVDEQTMASLWPGIDVCFEERDGRLYHPRLEREREKQIQYRQTQSEKAKSSWEKRMGKKGSAKATHRQANALLSSSSSSDNTYSPEFLNEWKKWPLRNGLKHEQPKAARAYARISKKDRPLFSIARENYGKSAQALRGVVRDMHRFIASEYWRGWLQPEQPSEYMGGGNKSSRPPAEKPSGYKIHRYTPPESMGAIVNRVIGEGPTEEKKGGAA